MTGVPGRFAAALAELRSVRPGILGTEYLSIGQGRPFRAVHGSQPPSTTVSCLSSIGATLIGAFNLAMTDDEWFGSTDRALYEAKASGRNRVCFASGPEAAGDT